MRDSLSLLLACVLAACATSPPDRYHAARELGYTMSQELRDVVDRVDLLESGVWRLDFQLSARSYRIASRVSPEAERLVAEALALKASQEPTYFTVLIHESAPRVKTTEAFAAPHENAPWPWVVVRFGAEPEVPASR